MNGADCDEQDALDMAGLARGHDASLNALMARHAGRLFHYLVRSLQDESDAADLAQETFVKVYQNRARFDGRQKFSTWLYAIAGNLVRDRYRWRKRHPQISLDAENETTGNDLLESLPEQKPSPADTLKGHERSTTIKNALAALPDDLRVPLILAEYEDRSQADIAAILGCTVKTVETRIYRARQQLRITLAGLLEP